MNCFCNLFNDNNIWIIIIALIIIWGCSGSGCSNSGCGCSNNVCGSYQNGLGSCGCGCN